MSRFRALLRQRKNFLGLLLVLACLAVDFTPRFASWSGYESWSLLASNGRLIPKPNSDPVNITNGLEQAQTWGDTLKWWTGPWAAGTALSFYRPLTSYFWWFQYRLWGPDCAVPILLVNYLLHVVFVFVLWHLLKQLAGTAAATLGCCFFVLGAGSLFSFATPHAALALWIDTPEMTCGISVLLALLCYLRYLRRGSARALAATCALYLIAIGWKEAAYVIPFFALLLLWHERQWGRWKSLLPLILITVVCFAYRTWALQGRGFHLGSNNSWKVRYINETIGGVVSTTAINYESLPHAFVCMAAALLLFRRHRKAALIFGAFGAFFLLLFQIGNRELDYPWLMVLVPVFWHKCLLYSVYAFLVWRFVLRRERRQLLGCGWVQAAYTPMLTTPITPHTFYFLAAGWSLWLACGFLDLAALCRAWMDGGPASLAAFLRLPAAGKHRLHHSVGPSDT